MSVSSDHSLLARVHASHCLAGAVPLRVVNARHWRRLGGLGDGSEALVCFFFSLLAASWRRLLVGVEPKITVRCEVYSWVFRIKATRHLSPKIVQIRWAVEARCRVDVFLVPSCPRSVDAEMTQVGRMMRLMEIWPMGGVEASVAL